MLTYAIISNWSTKDQDAWIAESEIDGVGKAEPRLSLTGDKALLKFDDSRFEEGGQFFEDEDFETFTIEEVKEEMNSEVWTSNEYF